VKATLFGMLDRRRFLHTVGAGLLAVPSASAAQPAGKVARVGILWAYSLAVSSTFGSAFRRGIRELGYVEGRSIVFEERWADGRVERLPALAAELIRLNLDVIVTASTPAVQAAQRATKTIPIVMTLVSDPVEDGVVAGLARPGGNVTGLSLMHPEVSAKRLALLKEVIPKLSRVTVLWTPSTAAYRKVLDETGTAGRALGVRLRSIQVRRPEDLDSAFATAVSDRTGAVIVLPDPWFRDRQRALVDLAAKNRLPAMYWSSNLVEAGGLMAYGASFPEVFR
jgi:putative ABC transport system substrate-binding protein